MDFFINNLAVLLTIVAIAGIVGFFWACNTTKIIWGTTTIGRWSAKTHNKSNQPKPMATHTNKFLC